MKPYNLFVCGIYADKEVRTFVNGFATESAARAYIDKHMHAAVSWLLTHETVIASANYPPKKFKLANLPPKKAP